MTDNSAEGATKPGHTAERVGFFTDAVFAIAMTLLVIEIPRPEAAEFEVGDGVTKTQAFEKLWHFLVAQHNAFYAYILAFFILWIVWRQHHVLFDQLDRLSVRMIGWHFPLLLMAAFLPYATTVMGHYPDNPLSALLLGLVVGVLLVCRSAIQSRAARDHALLPQVDMHRYLAEARVSWIVTGYWALTVLLVWWTPWVEIAWFLTGVVGSAGRLVGRWPAARAADE
jgi:TMEM175 potassium channel family protein